MALVKTTNLGSKLAATAATVELGSDTPPTRVTPRRSQDRARIRQQKAAERIGAATEELALGVGEAAAAAEQLRRALEQIASGAEEAASAAQESLQATSRLSSRFALARSEADAGRKQTEELQSSIVEFASQIDSSIAAIETNASRQISSVEIIEKLRNQAESIGTTTIAVADISDRTNLLALNAAIEAARAGDQGRGFAVVADEVRTLAEVAERSSRDVTKHSETIVEGVRRVSESIRATADKAREQGISGRAVSSGLHAIRSGLTTLSQSSQTILIAAVEAEVATREAQKGAEAVAAAAEQQSAAANEAQRSVQQQSSALEESQTTAQSLATLADELLTGSRRASGSEELSSAAEELSATVQELSGAAGEILIALEQINRGAESQATATQQANAAMAQIGQSALNAQQSAELASNRANDIKKLLATNRESVRGIVAGVAETLADTRSALIELSRISEICSQIERTVDRIVLVAVQTSMLAVSGSVEAARAGEAGRGFAVVSGDIRKLAQDAAENIDGVKDALRQIQIQTTLVHRELELIAAASETEMSKSMMIVGRLESAEADVDALVGGNTSIFASTQEILLSAKQVQNGTQQIAVVAQQASGASEQAATAARQQSRGAEDLAAAVEEIASLADELQLSGS